MPGMRARIRNRLPRAVMRRTPLRTPPFTLTGRSIYIVPTRNGLYFGAVVIVMLLGSMNYNNSLGFVLTFMLAATALVAMHHTQRNILRLQLYRVTAEPVIAGNRAEFRVELSNASRKTRHAIHVRSRESAGPPMTLAADGRATAGVSCTTSSRGRLACPRLRVETIYPMGLFRAWSWVLADACVLVYPEPVGDMALPMQSAGADDETAAVNRPGDEEFAGHQAYAAGDNPRRIDWKASARTDTLIVSRYADNSRASELWLDAAELAHLPNEARLSQLARWVLAAEHTGLRYGLRLPDECIGPAAGQAHAHACLGALALQP